MSGAAWTSGGGFTDLVAWRKAYDLVLEVYRVTRGFPDDERFGLIQQARRAAVSLVSNIAEGWGRGTTADYLRFVQMARGSANELQTQMWLAADLGFRKADTAFDASFDEVQRLLNGPVRALIDKTADGA